MIIKLILFISGLMILAVVSAYLCVVLLSLICFWFVRILRNLISIRKRLGNKSLQQLKQKREASHECGNQSWYAQYVEYVINCEKYFWWFPIVWLQKARQPYRMAENQGQKPRYNGQEERQCNLVPKIVDNDLAQPTPECHKDNVA